jgi:hypothetical protein
MSKRTSQSFTQSCAGALFLKGQFEKFDRDNSTGLDPSIVKPKEIREIYNKHKEFHKYSLGSFPTNYKNHASLYQISKAKLRAESTNKNKAARKAGKLFFFNKII